MRRAVSQHTPFAARCIVPTFLRRTPVKQPPWLSAKRRLRSLHTREEERSQQVKELNREGTNEHGRQLDDAIGQSRELQARTPWHREGSDKPPAKRMSNAGAMTKGKLLTTPSRLLKLIIPLTTLDQTSDRKSIEPLALLVHPQQPLSYLERLIQSELPLIKAKDGKTEKIPEVYFHAEDSGSDKIKADVGEEDEEEDSEEGSEEDSRDQTVNAKLVKPDIPSEVEEQIGKGEQKSGSIANQLRGGPGEGGIESYSGFGREGEGSEQRLFVRWSSSTEIGDFIRDAARGKEFAIKIEGSSAPHKEILIGVPSFNDRTHYLRVRLRKISRKLETYAELKKECDALAHKAGQRLAMGGFGVLVSWWFAIYYFTFQTDYGWDLMEPVTYLAGLTTIMIGYLWFLGHNREVSYRAALNLTISRRQDALYKQKGFDVKKWELLIEEANILRREVKHVADEYDVEWDEKQDLVSEEVHNAMREEREKKEKREDDDEDDNKDNDRSKLTKKS